METGHVPIRVLAYAPRRRRRWGRAWRYGIVCSALVAAAAAGWHWWGRAAWSRATYHHAWQRCMAFTAPPDAVAYEEDPASAARLMASSPEYRPPRYVLFNDSWYPAPPAGWGPPACYRPEVRSAVDAEPLDAVVFLHGRRTPGGTAGLVGVFAGPSAFGPRGHMVSLWRNVSLPSSWNTLPLRHKHAGEGLRIYLQGGEHLRLFAGQPDPADAAHFTIRYEIDGLGGGTIDGWLRDPGYWVPKYDPTFSGPSVELKVRDGPALDRLTEQVVEAEDPGGGDCCE